ncbi:unnamed protein product [Strongylus vulgaris]|uniref:Uncharacterized protein n=1 Tax=Strongylus vulgaris TaxID=40348 RepID=A0A3P7M3M9_STRVU|nr:unnamed protein product [Strongylus vulgaris]
MCAATDCLPTPSSLADVDCHPLWAKGMTAMFSYACGEGGEGYKKTECGEETSDWVIKYVTKFATAIDPRCKLASQLPSKAYTLSFAKK